jgi:hypothetical protein
LCRLGLAISLAAAAGPLLVAGDWPQILGPARDGVARDERLADAWPATGPKVLWQRSVGRGYAGLAVSGPTAVLFHREGDKETVEALDVQAGAVNWKVSSATAYVSGISPDDGPRCVPAIHDGRVVVFGVQGRLSCLNLADGRTLWTRDTHADFRAGEGYFGAGSSPLVEGTNVIVNVGGARTQAGVVAFSLETGRTVWQATNEEASYSSPVAVTVSGVRHLIVETRLTTVSLDPSSGRVRFRLPFGQRGPTVNGANPTLIGDRLFLTASYGIGATFARIETAKATVLWNSNDLISSQYTTCIRDGEALYGVHGRDDVGVAALRCIDPDKQQVLWEKDEFGYATLIKADDKLLAQKTDGRLVLIRCDKTKYTELSSAAVFDTKTFALPALACGRLFVRDERTLKCLSVGR